MSAIFGLLALLVGLALGDWFPDRDQHTNYLVHRSIITHGLLVPFFLFFLSTGIRRAPIRLFVMGISLSVAAHLSFDLFPKGWTGFALIHIPEYGETFPLASWLWIALSIICCLYIAMRLVRNGLEGTTLVISLPVAFTYASHNEHRLWLPLLCMIVTALIALALILRWPRRDEQWPAADQAL